MKKDAYQSFGSYLSLLREEDRRKYYLVSIIQATLGILDLIGVTMLGAMGALALRGINSQPPSPLISKLLEIAHLDQKSLQFQVSVLAIIATSILVTKTLATIYFNRKILFFLGRASANIASTFISRYFSQPISGIHANHSTEIQYSINAGVSSIVVGVLGVASTILADLTLLIIIGIGVFVIDPLTAMSSFVFFGAVVFFLHKKLNSKVKNLGMELARANQLTNLSLSEFLENYREIFVQNRRFQYSKNLGQLKSNYAQAFAEQTFLPNISKYVIELSLTVGSLVIAGIVFALNDATHAIASLFVFLAAGSRIAPALLRLQQSIMQIQSSAGMAHTTSELLEKSRMFSELLEPRNLNDFLHSGFVPSIKIENLSFQYPSEISYALNDVSLEINPGEFIGIVGRSGAGKSTLIDLLLGIQEPTSGRVLISNVPPIECIERWPGSIGFVPQNIGLIDSSFVKNIAIGVPTESIVLENIEYAIEKAQLKEFITEEVGGLNRKVQEQGKNISGGERQRIGIARALYTRPRLVIFDEATSSLDSQTEAAVTQSVEKLRVDTTLIVIAHRLSTVKSADRIVYLDCGKILAVGTFEEVRKAIPDFDSQASLMGL